MEIDFTKILDDLADKYPQVKKQALELKSDVMDLMPEEEPEKEPDLSLDEEDDMELELEL